MNFIENERCPMCGEKVTLDIQKFSADDEMCAQYGYQKGTLKIARYRIVCPVCLFSTGSANYVQDAVKDFYQAKNTILYPEGKTTARWYTHFPEIEGLYIIDEGLGPFLRRISYIGGKWITAYGPLEHIVKNAKFFGPIPNFTTQE